MCRRRGWVSVSVKLAGSSHAEKIISNIPVRHAVTGAAHCEARCRGHLNRPGQQGVTPVRALTRRFVADESGATAIEYGLIAALIAVVCITVMGTVGNNLKTKFQSVADNLK